MSRSCQKGTNDLGLRDCPSDRKNLSNRSTSGPFEFVKNSHDRGATFVTFIRAIDSKLALLRHFNHALEQCGRTSNPNLGGCPSHHWLAKQSMPGSRTARCRDFPGPCFGNPPSEKNGDG
jgi:hypothetical protein